MQSNLEMWKKDSMRWEQKSTTNNFLMWYGEVMWCTHLSKISLNRLFRTVIYCATINDHRSSITLHFTGITSFNLECSSVSTLSSCDIDVTLTLNKQSRSNFSVNMDLDIKIDLLSSPSNGVRDQWRLQLPPSSPSAWIDHQPTEVDSIIGIHFSTYIRLVW